MANDVLSTTTTEPYLDQLREALHYALVNADDPTVRDLLHDASRALVGVAGRVWELASLLTAGVREPESAAECCRTGLAKVALLVEFPNDVADPADLVPVEPAGVDPDRRPALPAAYAALGDAESVATEAAVVPVLAARNDVHRAILAVDRAVTLLSLAVHRPEQARVHARAALQTLGRVVELPRSDDDDHAA